MERDDCQSIFCEKWNSNLYGGRSNIIALLDLIDTQHTFYLELSQIDYRGKEKETHNMFPAGLWEIGKQSPRMALHFIFKS